MKLVNAVYVPLDRSDAAKAVIPIASALADALGATLCFVHAMEHAGAADDLLEYLQLQRKQLHHAILEPLEGEPAEMISKTIAEHPRSMVVMPVRSGENAGSAGLGPVSLQVLKNARCPVVLVPHGGEWENWKPMRMLLPQDSTAACAAAVAPAAEIADHSKASLTLLHVPSYSGKPFSPEQGALPLPRYQDHQPQHALVAWREEFIERLREMGHVTENTKLKLILGMNDPADEILAWDKKLAPDLIVLPWYGDFEHASVLKKVLLETRSPVMVIPIAEHAKDEKAA